MFRFIFLSILLFPAFCIGQHKGVSYRLTNEVGTFHLTSLTYSHRIDNHEGVTYVTDRTGKDTIYRIEQFMNGYVGLSNDGRTVVNLNTEKDGAALKRSVISFYRNGALFESAELNQFLKYELDEAIKYERLPSSGWLKNDSLLHRMASNAFYISDDKVFISFDGPLLKVFDLNRMFHLFTGNGANHFMQNYYAIPSLPLRMEYTTSEYFPKEFPQTENGRSFEEVLTGLLQSKTANAEDAKFRVEMDLKVNNNGNPSVLKAKVFEVKKNAKLEEKSKLLNVELSKLKFDTSLLPPAHPAWIFHGNFWLK